MPKTSALSEAQTTCDGLHRLIRRLGEAAIDIDKGGSDTYEIQALIASANTCVINLGTQLTILESNATNDDSNVHPIKRDNAQTHFPDTDQSVKAAK